MPAGRKNYARFPNKEALFTAVVMQSIAANIARFEAHTPIAPNSRASRSAVAFPIPELAPVTIATEFDMLFSACQGLLFSACQGLLQVPVTERIASRITSRTAAGAVTMGV
jgi:AcrR family transcriptional regulator